MIHLNGGGASNVVELRDTVQHHWTSVPFPAAAGAPFQVWSDRPKLCPIKFGAH